MLHILKVLVIHLRDVPLCHSTWPKGEVKYWEIKLLTCGYGYIAFTELLPQTREKMVNATSFSSYNYWLCTLFMILFYTIIDYIQYTVTCQPIVGLRSRALLGSRSVNRISAQTRWRHATALEYGSCATGRHDVTRQHARFRGNVVVNIVTWRNRVDSLRFSFRWFWLYKRSA
jgi:hypothetical protein